MKSYLDITDVYEAQQIIERRVAGTPLKVKFKTGAKTAATSQKEVILPRPTVPMTREDFELLYYYVIHECGHHSRPKVFDIAQGSGIDQNSALAYLYNAIEDQVMERHIAALFKGDAKSIGRGNTHHVSKMLKGAVPDESEMDEDMIKSNGVFLMGQHSRLEWDSYASPSVYAIDKHLPQPIHDVAEELTNAGFLDRVNTCGDEHESWDLTVDIYKHLFKDHPDYNEEKVEEVRANGHEGGENPDKSTEGNKRDGVPTAYRKGKGDDATTEDGITRYSWKDLANSDHEAQSGGKPAVINWDGHKCTEKVTIADSSHYKVYNYSRSKAPIQSRFTEPRSGSSSALANRARTLLQARARTRVRPEREHGMIDKRALTRVAMPPIDGGRWNRKVFYDRTEKREINTAISLVVDFSGSMHGDKMKLAAQTAALIKYSFSRVLNIPIHISSFTTTSGNKPVVIGNISDFSERSVSQQQIMNRFAKFAHHSGGNDDSDSILWAYQRLRKRTEARRIMIVLSDGAPTCTAHGGSADTNLRHVTKTIQDKKEVELFGIGICDTQVKRYYKQYKVVNDENELPSTIIALLKDTV